MFKKSIINWSIIMGKNEIAFDMRELLFNNEFKIRNNGHYWHFENVINEEIEVRGERNKANKIIK